MARIQNPCNQFGKALATEEHVTEVTNNIKAGLTYTFVGNEDRTPGFVGNDYIKFTFEEDSEIKNGYNSTVTIKPIESLEGLNSAEDLSYTLATGPLVKEVKDKLEGDIKKAKLTIGGKNVKTNLDELVRDINKDDIINDNDVEEGITYKGILQTNGLNFRGDHVIIVENKDGKTVDLWFGPNNNPGFATKLDESKFTGSNYYIFNDASTPKNYFLHTSGAFSAGTKNIAVAASETETIVLKNKNDGTEVNFADSDSTLQCIIKRVVANDTIEEEIIESPKINEENATNKAITYTSKGVKFEITDIVKNTDADAEKGLTPGFVRYKATIKLENGTIMPNGGIYRVEIKAANSTVATQTKELFVFKDSAEYEVEPPSPTVTAVYKSESDTYISGLKYDTAGTITLNISNISNTQQMATPDLDRINITTTSINGNYSFASIPALLREDNNKEVTTTPNTTVIGNAKDNNAVFSYTVSSTVTGVGDIQPSGYVTVTPYYIKNKVKTKSTKSGTVYVTSSDDKTHYSWTQSKLNDSSLEASFENESGRICGELANNKLLILEETYKSEKSIGTDAEANYANQALVQYGTLRHPSNIAEGDRASTYSNSSGTKYFVKLIKWKDKLEGSPEPVASFKVTVKSGINKLGNSTSPVKLYAADVKTLKAVRIDSTEANGGTAVDGSFENGSWSVGIPTTAFNIYRHEGFYLIIEMTENAQNIGAITII